MSDKATILVLAVFAVTLITIACVLGIQRDAARDEVKELNRHRVVCPMCNGAGVVDLPEAKERTER